MHLNYLANIFIYIYQLKMKPWDQYICDEWKFIIVYRKWATEWFSGLEVFTFSRFSFLDGHSQRELLVYIIVEGNNNWESDIRID